jgi:hypothetical protein
MFHPQEDGRNPGFEINLYLFRSITEPHRQKGMKIISVQGDKAMVITYASQDQDFDKFISSVDRMVGTFRILE